MKRKSSMSLQLRNREIEKLNNINVAFDVESNTVRKQVMSN